MLLIDVLAQIYCFNVPISASILKIAVAKNILIEQFNVIYKLVENLKSNLSSKLSPNIEFKLLGTGHVLKEFMIPDRTRKRFPVAGVYVDSGFFEK